MILGLDISSSIIGMTLLNNDEELIDLDCVDISKIDNIYLKVVKFFEFFDLFFLKANNIQYKLQKDCGLDKIAIEDILTKFSAGGSSANTIIVLATINAMVSYEFFRRFNIKPVHIPVSTARRLNGLKFFKGEDRKEKTLQRVKQNISGDFSLIWKYKSKGKNKGADSNQNYDISDSYIIAKAYKGYIVEQSIKN